MSTLRNFFLGFLTLDELKAAAGGQPLRVLRPLLTPEREQPQRDEKKRSKREQMKDASRMRNPALAAQLAKRREDEELKRVEEAADDTDRRDELPTLQVPEFMDYQDFVSPVFRLDLRLPRDDPGDEARTGQGSRILFSRSDEEIIGGFSDLVDRMVSSFDDFCRPEFCKVEELHAEGYQARLRELGKRREEKAAADTAFPGKQADGLGRDANFSSAGVPVDFEKLLYAGDELGPEGYCKFIGKVQARETDRRTKGHRKELIRGASALTHLGPGKKEPTYIDRFLRVAHHTETCFIKAKQDILRVVEVHLQEAKRVLEIFDQFEGVIRGSVARKVRQVLVSL